jgi:hypothetical protein
MWTLRAEGHLFHSGLPHKGINSLELGMEAIAYLQKQFYQDFPPVCTSLRQSGKERKRGWMWGEVEREGWRREREGDGEGGGRRYESGEGKM